MSAGGGGLVADAVDALLLRGMFVVVVVVDADVELVLAGDNSDGLDVKTGYIYIQNEEYIRCEREEKKKEHLVCDSRSNLYHWEKKGKTETPHTRRLPYSGMVSLDN